MMFVPALKAFKPHCLFMTSFVVQKAYEVVVAIRLPAGRSEARIPVQATHFYLLVHHQTNFGAHLTSFSVDNEITSRLRATGAVKLTILFYLKRLRINGALPLLPLYAWRGQAQLL